MFARELSIPGNRARLVVLMHNFWLSAAEFLMLVEVLKRAIQWGNLIMSLFWVEISIGEAFNYIEYEEESSLGLTRFLYVSAPLPRKGIN